MAKVKQVYTCKACGSELKDKNQEKCHVCGFVLKALPSKYSSPDYIYYQEQDFAKDLKGTDSRAQTKLAAHNAEKMAWFQNCPEEDHVAALDDAFNHLRHLLASGASRETKRKTIKLGIRIGKLASSAEAFILSGGFVNGTGAIESAETRDSDQGDADS